MKRFVWIIGLIFCITCTIQAKDRVIERPPFLAWSSNSIEVDKIVMSDTVTTVYIKAFYHPKYWIKIATGSFLKDNNGMLYPIRRGVGITLDKEFWMPESGEAEFQLQFPPIPENVTSLDFSEGDFDGAYKIWGIQLDKDAFYKQKLPKEAVVHKINKKAILPTPKLVYGTATLKGKILDYQKEMIKQVKMHIESPALNIHNEQNIIKIKEDGTFLAEVKVASVTSVALEFPFGWIECLIAPNEETSLIINTKELCRRQAHLQRKDKTYGEPVYFNGYLASLQQELASVDIDIVLISVYYMDMYNDIVGKSADEYKAYVLERLPSVRKEIAQSPYSNACKELLNILVDLDATGKIAMTERELKSAHIAVNKLNREQADDYFYNTRIDTPKGYYDILKEFSSINTLKALYGKYYASTIYLINFLPNSLDVLKETLRTGQGPLFDNIKFNKLYQSIKDFTPLTAEQNVELKTFSSPVYAEMLTQVNKEIIKKIELNKRKTGFTVNETGQVSNEDLFPSIISKFRGHTLLVDFWATWCGPCRTANKAITPMKEELKDKDIIYLYITGETSPKGTWENMITDIHGEHFRVTNEQWSFLMSNFNIRGVPTYFVVDPEGNITFKQTGFPGVDTMKKELMKALNK